MTPPGAASRTRRGGWTRHLLRAAVPACGAALVLAATLLRDPRLFAIRTPALIALIALGLLGGLTLILRWRRRGGAWPVALALLWAVGPVLAIWGEIRFARQVAAVTRSAEEGAALGRHFLIGYTDARDVAPLAARGLIGGIFVTARNAAHRPAEALREEIAALQALRREAGLPPLFVATDQEGGAVSRLSPPLPPSPTLGSLAARPPSEREDAARALGTAQGAGLAGLGVNVNFAPVLDLPPAGGPTLWDRNSRITERAIPAEAATVAALGLAYARGLAESGVTATLKHFPGLGRATADTHHFTTRIGTPRAELEATDWVPFRHALAGARPWVMLAHATVEALDPDRPASLSPRVTRDLLRGAWGFDGIVVTDDLNMAPVFSAGLCDGVVSALNAGVDVLLISWDPTQYYPAMACALEARRAGRLDETALAASRVRLSRAAPPLPTPAVRD